MRRVTIMRRDLSASKRRKQVFISSVNAAPQPIYAGCISEFLFWNLET